MPGAHDASMREHLTVSVTATTTDVVVRLAARAVGHAAPTGDPFHHVEVALGAGPDCDDPVRVRFVRALGSRDDRLVVLADRRVPPGHVSTEQRVGRRPAATHWCARYVFADLRHEPLLSASAFAAPMGGGPLGP